MGATAMASTAYGLGCWGVHEVRLCGGKNPQKKRQDIVVLHVHSAESLQNQGSCAKQNSFKISRREGLALGICIVENAIAGSCMWDKQLKAEAVQEDTTADKTSKSDNAQNRTDADGNLDSPLNGLLSLFDPNEKTKSGKVLPKSYLKSARNVVKSLKESLKEESSKESDVRKSADQAKEAIRDYLLNWRGQKAVESEDSYKALEGAIKILGKFYGKQGPRAALPSDVKSEILTNLEAADAAL